MAKAHSHPDHLHQETAFEDTHHLHHIVPPKVYAIVITCLMVLTIFTVIVAYKNWGHLWLNVTIALTVAIIKASIVVLYFMHVRWSGRLIHVTLGASILFFFVLIAGVMMDQASRATTVTPAYDLTYGPPPALDLDSDGAHHGHDSARAPAAEAKH